MNLDSLPELTDVTSIPRVSGGEPSKFTQMANQISYSPRERG